MTTEKTTVKVTIKQEGAGAIDRVFDEERFVGHTPDEVLIMLGVFPQGAVYRVKGNLLPLSRSDFYELEPGDTLEVRAI